MLLTIDIGNTNIGLCVFNGPEIVFSCHLATDLNKLDDEYGIVILNLLKYANLDCKVSSCLISSVVSQLDDTFLSAIKKYLNVECNLVSYKMKLPFEIKIDNPKTLGADRIANAAFACDNFKLPVIVADFGTATTFDVIDKDKNFIGGLIAPGIMIQARSLAKFTSKLPKIKIEAPKCAISKNTIDAMMAGVVTGHAKMIEGMIKECEKELKSPATIVATGGLSDVLLNSMERKFDVTDKNLTHKGIRRLYDINYAKH